MHPPQQTPQRTPERAAVVGLLLNAALATVKLIAGIVGHSFALVADSVESMVDIAGSLIVWRALRYGARPPDEDHPFGHGKVEALAAMTVGLLIIMAGVGIAVKSIDGIITPHEMPAWYTLVVLIAVVLIKEGLFRFTREAATMHDSTAGHADAWHHRSDAITSAAAAVGITVALVGGERYAPADDWAALLASGVIVANGLMLMRSPMAELMDAASPRIAAECGEIAMEIDGIRRIERCDARKVGRTYRVIMHAEVDPTMTVTAAHALTGRVKALVRERLPAVTSLLIHVEPWGEG
jgi:cation diffusion facilitator family transporter